jgi:SsrA-binding protein
MAKTSKTKIVTASGHSGPIAVNRKAYHEYDILETVEAGLVLTGTEIKSVRASKIDIQHAFARMDHGEMWLINAHIAPYAQGNIYNHEPTRPRKLLLHNKELGELAGTASQKGLTLIPLRVYIKGHVAKVQVGLARGRQLHDKRRAIMDKDQEREIGRAMRAASRG